MEFDTLSPLEKEQVSQLIGYGGALPEGKHNVHSFLNNVATSEDTTKTGNLTADEVGIPKHPLRTFKNLSLIANDIMGNPDIANYYNKKAEILTSTSLSKDAKLLTLAVVQKKEIADTTVKPRKENKGWFKKSSNSNSEGNQENAV